MNLLGWAVLTLYTAEMIGLSIYLGRGQTSAISFIPISAFVAPKPGGGLTWL